MVKIEQITSFEPALAILNQIPEFSERFTIEEFVKRLQNDPVILIAYYNGVPVGCKIGYNRFENNVFYSWLGGVLSEFRRKNVAQKLANGMEQIAKARGYEFIQFKTRNKFKSMILFGLKNGFQIVDFIPKEDKQESRIILRKRLL
ncbi:MAG TPA: GNAT family N-acetyltransferase [Draconibacterium sp.]|nr:GNAT family N-acetyltransferase [Draconibacterium sp.]